MKRRFLCCWKDERQDEAEPFLSNTHSEAYKNFLKGNYSRMVPVLVWNEDQDDPIEFTDHLMAPKEADDSASLTPSTLGSIEKKIDELNENLKFFKRYIVIIAIALIVLMSWTALGATGSWWKWFAFVF